MANVLADTRILYDTAISLYGIYVPMNGIMITICPYLGGTSTGVRDMEFLKVPANFPYGNKVAAE